MNPADSITEPLLYKILDRVYPVGSLYMQLSDTRNPSEILGFGQWERVMGRYIYAEDGTNIGAVDGSWTHWHWQTFGSDPTGYASVAGASSGGRSKVITTDRATYSATGRATAGARLDGTEDATVVPPLIRTYVWKRIA